jgi:hypothetical protein
LRDAYYHDEGEFRAALCVCTTQLMRAMRDRGVRGHVILGDLPLLEELEDLSGQKVLFYTENPDPDNLSLLLEFQRNIAVPSEGVSLVCNLLEEFDIASIIVIDPTREALARALSYFDKDAVFAGGYCRKECSQYWKHLIDSAYIHQ